MNTYRKFVDTLQSELRTPAPPNPPKVPKANPSEPDGLPVLGGLGTLGAATLKNETSPHAATPPPLPFSEATADGEHGREVPLVGTAIIAPGKWVERIASPASSEPGFSEPWPPRRGWIESQGNTLLHFCCICGAVTARRQFAWRQKWGGGSAPLTALTAGPRSEHELRHRTVLCSAT
jgi:hypothetical protein